MISGYSVKKPFTVFVAVILIVLLGVISFTNMTTDLLPKMDLPYALIITTYVGASPEKVETVVTKPMEQSMATVSNVKNISSVSSENSSMVILEFSNDVNMDSALIELNGKIDLIKANWNDSNIGAPIVSKINPNMLPVMISAVDVGEMDLAEIKNFVNQNILPELERISGVASVSATGIVEEKLEIKLNQAKIDEVNTKLTDHVNATLSKTGGELNSAKAQLAKGKEELQKQSNEQMGKLLDGLKQIQTGISTIASTESELATKEEGLKFTKTTLTTTLQGMEQALVKLNDEKAQLVKLGEAVTEEQKARLELLNNSITKTEKLKNETTAKLKEVEVGLTQLTVGKTELAKQKTSLQQKEVELEKAKATLTIELSKAASKLEQGEQELEKGIKEFEVARDEALKSASIDGIITQEMVSNILMANNFSMPAGYIETEEDKMLIKVGDKFENLEEIENMTLLSFEIEGLEKVTLKDLADIGYADNSSEVYAKVNGNNAIMLSFQKQSTASTAEVCKEIEQTMEQLEQKNEGVRFTTLMNQGIYIDLIIGTVLENLFYGAILAVIILLLFLKDYKPTIIIALSIPISLTFAIALMYFTGVTINIISLSGLALGVGMLVDNSIVVIENIYRLRQEGSSVKEASIQGAARVAGAIAASTLTTVCVFLPIVFVEGISRQLFTDMGLTIGYSLLASLIVALTLVPAMASKMFKNTNQRETKLFDKFVGAYEKTLKVALNHKAIVIIFCVVLLITSAILAGNMGTAFIPDVEGTQMSITITPPKEVTKKEAQDKTNEIVGVLLENIKEIDTIGAINSSAMGSMSLSNGTANTMNLYAILKEDKKTSNKEIEKRIYELTKDCGYEISVSTSNMDMSSMMSSGIQIVIKGKETEELQKIAKEITSMIEQIDGIDSVDSGVSETQKEKHVVVNKDKAMEYGLTVAGIYQTIVSEVSNQKEATDVTIENKDYPVVVVKQEEKKTTTDNLGAIKLSGKKNNETVEVALSDVANIEETDGLSSIQHDKQERYVSVTATVKTDSNVGLVGREVQNKLKEYTPKEGYTVELQGESETINQSLKDLGLMILLAIVFIYLIMVAQFQSLKSPFIVMFTIPLAFTGGLLALWICGCEISLIAMLGFLMLAGVVVNNGIVFIDYANYLRKEKGLPVKDALIQTGKTRLKPILMTALTTILGLSTMALGMGQGSEMIQPLGMVTIGGLVYSTMLTLYLVPALYMIMNKDKKKS